MTNILNISKMYSFLLVLLWMISVHFRDGIAEMEEGMCAPYGGKICKNYLDARQVWFQVSNEGTGGWLNEHITKGLWDEMISGLREPCRSAAEVTHSLLHTI